MCLKVFEKNYDSFDFDRDSKFKKGQKMQTLSNVKNYDFFKK
jgi:hypothetical protein